MFERGLRIFTKRTNLTPRKVDFRNEIFMWKLQKGKIFFNDVEAHNVFYADEELGELRRYSTDEQGKYFIDKDFIAMDPMRHGKVVILLQDEL